MGLLSVSEWVGPAALACPELVGFSARPPFQLRSVTLPEFSVQHND